MGERVPESVARLARIAHALDRTAVCRKLDRSWPTLWLFTDPDRTPDVLDVASRLPRGTGIVLRTFGMAEAEALAEPLARLAHGRQLVLLVGADAALAVRIGADGIHLPQRLMHRLPRLRACRPTWRFTVAVHNARALEAAKRVGADAAFLSPVLPSLSPSATQPLGPTRTAVLVRGAGLPVYGLGGVDAGTAARLKATGLSGLAGIGFAASEPPRT